MYLLKFMMNLDGNSCELDQSKFYKSVVSQE